MKNLFEFEITKTIASILARQFYSGWSKKERCQYSWKEYKDKSLKNWMDSVRGIIYLTKRARIK